MRYRQGIDAEGCHTFAESDADLERVLVLCATPKTYWALCNEVRADRLVEALRLGIRIGKLRRELRTDGWYYTAVEGPGVDIDAVHFCRASERR